MWKGVSDLLLTESKRVTRCSKENGVPSSWNPVCWMEEINLFLLRPPKQEGLPEKQLQRLLLRGQRKGRFGLGAVAGSKCLSNESYPIDNQV